MEYDESRELGNYIRANLQEFATKEEWEAYRALADNVEREHPWNIQEAKKLALSGKRLADIKAEQQRYWEPVGELRQKLETLAFNRVRSGHNAHLVPRCPKCSRLLRTSRAKQCFWCGADWH